MKSTQKSFLVFIIVIFIAGMVATSCRTPHSACPAYGGEAKRFQIDRTY